MIKDLQDKYIGTLKLVKHLNLTTKTQEAMLSTLSNVPWETLEMHAEVFVIISLIQAKAKQFQITSKLDVGSIARQLENMNSENEVDNLFRELAELALLFNTKN